MPSIKILPDNLINKIAAGEVVEKKVKEERYLEIFKEEVSAENIRGIIRRTVSDALKGDATARRFIFDYLVGPPVERKEVTGLDAGPIVFEVVYEK